MKTFVLTVSKYFPKTHSRAGESTGFVESLSNLFIGNCKKIHTIRSNYELWKKRADQINNSEAILSVRYWSGKPYNSKQVEILRLERIGVEKLENPRNYMFAEINGNQIDWGEIADNDGLSFDDFCEWFKVRQLEPMPIIHFTNFRYSD